MRALPITGCRGHGVVFRIRLFPDTERGRPAAADDRAATDKFCLRFAFMRRRVFRDVFCYGAGYIGGPRFVRYLGGRFLRERESESFAYYRRHGELVALAGNPLCRTYIAFVAGRQQMPLRRVFLIGITLGTRR